MSSVQHITLPKRGASGSMRQGHLISARGENFVRVPADRRGCEACAFIRGAFSNLCSQAPCGLHRYVKVG